MEMHQYIDKTYDDFLTYQELVIEILDEFHRICKKHDFPYVVAYGTLLGFIRDGGNIPWDYDVDVLLPYTYIDRLIKVLKTDLSSGFYYVYEDNTRNYPTSCLRICKCGYSYMALHVDVFFLIGCPSEKKEQQIFKNKIRWICNARQAKTLNQHLHPDRNLGLFRRIITYIRYPVSMKWILKQEKKLSSQFQYEECQYCTAFFPFAKTYTRRYYDEIQICEINGREYNIPKAYDSCLTEWYGNYHEYLPISKRFEEFYHMKKNIDERQDVYQKYLKQNIEQ